MKTGCIYKIANLINGKVYIGQSMNVLERWKRHKIGDTKCPAIRAAIRKYGAENFSFLVIEDNLAESELPDRECYWIEYYDSYSKGYNLTPGGEVCPSKLPDVRKKMSENNHYKGRHGLDNPHFGMKRSAETKAKMSRAHRGNKNHTFGKPRSPEVRKKISDTLKKRNKKKS